MGSQIFRALFPKVAFKKISLFPTHVFSLVAAALDTLPVTHRSFVHSHVSLPF